MLTLIPVVLKLGAAQIGGAVRKSRPCRDCLCRDADLAVPDCCGVSTGSGLWYQGPEDAGRSGYGGRHDGNDFVLPDFGQRRVYPHYDLAPMARRTVEISIARWPLCETITANSAFWDVSTVRCSKSCPGTFPDGFNDHPNGLMFIRTKNPDEYKEYDVLYKQQYRLTNDYVIVRKTGSVRRS